MNGSLGPMARTVTDLAKLLDGMVGYDPEDPITAHGMSQIPPTFTAYCEASASKEPALACCGSRWAMIRSLTLTTSPRSRGLRPAIDDLRGAGAEVIDPVSSRGWSLLDASGEAAIANPCFDEYFTGGNAPFATLRRHGFAALCQRHRSAQAGLAEY